MKIDDFASYCKRRGIIFPSSDIYGGISGFYDYGPIGVEIKNNIKQLWWKSMVTDHDNVAGIDGSIITHPKVWDASGHVDNFVDLFVECKKCHSKIRADHLVEDVLKKPADGLSAKQLNDLIKKNGVKCQSCKSELGEVSEFNLMFRTPVGPEGDYSSFLRPETAQVIFTNFNNVLDTCRMKIPFGIAQIGKAFRNEISPRNFLFRLREFEQMEMEFFVDPEKKADCPDFELVADVEANVLTAKEQEKKHKTAIMKMGDVLKKKLIKSKWHAYWIGRRYKWFLDLGINPDKLRLREHVDTELSHYSSATWDIEYNYDFGWKELEGIADRTDFDLKQHEKHSGTKMQYFDEETQRRFVPHVAAEPSVGVDRAFLTFIADAYHEEEIKGKKRVVLKLHPKLAAYKVAVFPLVKKDGLPEKALDIYNDLRTCFTAFYDQAGSIGRRYRRMDEIGTPLCITVDYDTKDDDSVTIRDRDSLEQKRVKISELKNYIWGKICS